MRPSAVVSSQSNVLDPGSYTTTDFRGDQALRAHDGKALLTIVRRTSNGLEIWNIALIDFNSKLMIATSFFGALAGSEEAQ